MSVTLYGIPASHPVYAAMLMLERKGVEYRRVDLPQWFHRGVLRQLLGVKGRHTPFQDQTGSLSLDAKTAQPSTQPAANMASTRARRVVSRRWA